jgi:hypothetical protein
MAGVTPELKADIVVPAHIKRATPLGWRDRLQINRCARLFVQPTSAGT